MIQCNLRRGGSQAEYRDSIEFGPLARLFDVSVIDVVTVCRECDADVMALARRRETHIAFHGDLTQPQTLFCAFVHNVRNVLAVRRNRGEAGVPVGGKFRYVDALKTRPRRREVAIEKKPIAEKCQDCESHNSADQKCGMAKRCRTTTEETRHRATTSIELIRRPRLDSTVRASCKRWRR